MSDLDTALIAAHDNGDATELVTLYTRAADSAPDLDAECFFLTHAFIFALELGDTRADDLRARLVLHGREVPA